MIKMGDERVDKVGTESSNPLNRQSSLDAKPKGKCWKRACLERVSGRYYTILLSMLDCFPQTQWVSGLPGCQMTTWQHRL